MPAARPRVLVRSAMLLLTVTGLLMLVQRLGWLAGVLRSDPRYARPAIARRARPHRGCRVDPLVADGRLDVSEHLRVHPRGGPRPSRPSPRAARRPRRSVRWLPCRLSTSLTSASSSFPAPDDRTDVFTLRTAMGEARIDQATGQTLAFTPATALDRIKRGRQHAAYRSRRLGAGTAPWASARRPCRSLV